MVHGRVRYMVEVAFTQLHSLPLRRRWWCAAKAAAGVGSVLVLLVLPQPRGWWEAGYRGRTRIGSCSCACGGGQRRRIVWSSSERRVAAAERVRCCCCLQGCARASNR